MTHMKVNSGALLLQLICMQDTVENHEMEEKKIEKTQWIEQHDFYYPWTANINVMWHMFTRVSYYLAHDRSGSFFTT